MCPGVRASLQGHVVSRLPSFIVPSGRLAARPWSSQQSLSPTKIGICIAVEQLSRKNLDSNSLPNVNMYSGRDPMRPALC